MIHFRHRGRETEDGLGKRGDEEREREREGDEERERENEGVRRSREGGNMRG